MKVLEPGERTLLHKALEPPEGYRLDFAIGTTFSLDLLALLTAPLAFTLFDRRMEDPDGRENSLELLESLRRYAKRIAIFCQAGRIALPRARYPQFAWLEHSVVECRRPEAGGVFHPKVWILRYADNTQSVRYRALCLSRNLTLANSWDTLLMAEGELRASGRLSTNPRPLADFVRALPSLALHDVPDATLSRIEAIAEELLRVAFAPPPGFSSLDFHPLGLDGYREWPFTVGGGRLLVISPFISLTALERLSEGRSSASLVSTTDALAGLPERPKRFEQFWTLDEHAIAELPADESAELAPDEIVQLSGLHAKTYVVEHGQEADLWTGSANCTEGGFKGNIEFLMHLTGPKDRCGIDTMLKPVKEGERLITILQDAGAVVAKNGPDELARGLEKRLEDARAWLAERCGSARIDENAEEYDIVLCARPTHRALPPVGVTMSCWPVMVGEARGCGVQSGEELARFERISFEGLSAFFAFRVIARQDAAQRDARFVLKIPLEGAPPDREERMLRTLIGDRTRFIRFLTLLLCDDAEEPPAPPDAMPPPHDGSDSSARSDFAARGMFEMLVRALDRSPERLDDVAKLVEDLARQSNRQPLFPDGFEAVWRPIWEVRRQMVQTP